MKFHNKTIVLLLALLTQFSLTVCAAVKQKTSTENDKIISIVALNTSPVKNGNSETLLNSFLKGTKTNKHVSIKVINVSELHIKPWLAKSTKLAVIEKVPLPPVYKFLKTADIIVVASPIYMASLPAQLKALIDRSGPLFYSALINNKHFRSTSSKGYFLCVEGSGEMQNFYDSRRIIKEFFQNIVSIYSGEVFCTKVNIKGDINKRKKVLKKAYNMGVNAVKSL